MLLKRDKGAYVPASLLRFNMNAWNKLAPAATEGGHAVFNAGAAVAIDDTARGFTVTGDPATARPGRATSSKGED